MLTVRIRLMRFAEPRGTFSLAISLTTPPAQRTFTRPEACLSKETQRRDLTLAAGLNVRRGLRGLTTARHLSTGMILDLCLEFERATTASSSNRVRGPFGSPCLRGDPETLHMVPTRDRSTILALALVGLTCAAALSSADAPTSSPPQTLETFLDAPSLQSWRSLEEDVRAGRYDAPEMVVAQVLEYHSAREKRDLPNSMALSGISPEEFVKQEAARADASLARIRAGQTGDLWRLLQVMASQTFDDGLVFTAAEIAARLTPSRFEAMASVAAKARPENAWIFERIRERWLTAKKG